VLAHLDVTNASNTVQPAAMPDAQPVRKSWAPKVGRGLPARGPAAPKTNPRKCSPRV
jgi:hypothetical protein